MTDNEISEKKQKDIDKNIERIQAEREEFDHNPRFGFFSVPYPATVGDRAYSQKNKYKNFQIVERKVITEKRNIFSRPLLKGKTNDVYFSPIEPISDQEHLHFKELSDKEREDYLKRMKEKRETKTLSHFKPGGPQETFGFYFKNEAPESTGPIYEEKNKKSRIMEGRKVWTENRGIYTNPTKKGQLVPNEYFHFYGQDDEVEKRIKEGHDKDMKDRLDKVALRKQRIPGKPEFRPAALKKNEPFFNNEKTYGMYTDEERDKLMEEYRDFKKNGHPKYKKILPPGSVKHINPFKSARLVFSGRDGLFNDDLYKIPELKENEKTKILTVKEKKALEEERKRKNNNRMPFTYNKLMNNSTFAPGISCNKINLRREFPIIKSFH